MILLAVVLACVRPEPPADPVPVLAPEPGTFTAAIHTPRSTYERCEARVEGADRAGECTSDADCVRAGCSSEVCVPRAEAEGLVTSCDKDACFDVLDQCLCAQGACRWTVKLPPGALQKLPIVPKEAGSAP